MVRRLGVSFTSGPDNPLSSKKSRYRPKKRKRKNKKKKGKKREKPQPTKLKKKKKKKEKGKDWGGDTLRKGATVRWGRLSAI